MVYYVYSFYYKFLGTRNGYSFKPSLISKIRRAFLFVEELGL
jgi:hypothetical protein